ncbi:hypothetical protein SELMODRAFT_127198, partial [Selaginella moellendorffii]
IVILPYPGQGHINPLLQLSLALASTMGFRVTFVSTRKNHGAIVLSPEDRGIGIHLATIPDEMLPE